MRPVLVLGPGPSKSSFWTDAVGPLRTGPDRSKAPDLADRGAWLRGTATLNPKVKVVFSTTIFLR